MTHWFPFFSMLFWCATKIAGLVLILSGFWALLAMMVTEFRFWQLLVMCLVPMAVGIFLLVSDLVYDLATAEQRRRQSVAK